MYNYELAVREDMRDYLEGCFEETAREYGKEKFCEMAVDSMMESDAVTGNASGSYFCNCFRARDAVVNNIDLLREACDCMGYENPSLLDDDFELWDIWIRTYIVRSYGDEIADEFWEEMNGGETE